MKSQIPAVMEAPWIPTDIQTADFENEFWQAATPIAITRTWAGDPAPAQRHAEARILWSGEALHVRFVCNQHEPPIVNPKPQVAKKTIGLWDRDVCEIFIAPDPQQSNRYSEFEAAPTGEWVDLGIHITPTGRETDWEYNSHMSTAAHVATNRVVIAMRIPWDEWIHKPHRGETWRVNLFRCIGTGDERYLAWQPTYAPEPNFHVPEVFGSLYFT